MAFAPPGSIFDGQEIGDYTRPDGTSVRLPASVAAALGLQSFTPEPPIQTSPTGSMPHAGASQLQMSSPMPMGMTPASSPSPNPKMSGGAGPNASPMPNAQNQAPPAAKPTTAKDLRGDGYGTVLDQQQSALDASAKAGEDEAQKQAALLDQRVAAREASQAKIDEIADKRAKDADAQLALINQKQSDVDAALDQISKQKIDRSQAHPVLVAIGLALSGIGAAMQNKSENPALDVLYKAIDRKVQAQMADREAAIGATQLKSGQINSLRQHLTDRNAYYDGLTAAEIRKADSMVAQLADRSTSETVKANAQKLRADLQLKGADYRSNAIDKQSAEDWRVRQFTEEQKARAQQQALGWAGLADARAERADRRAERGETMQFEREKFAYTKEYNQMTLDAEAQKLAAAGKAAQAKAVAERGIGGVARPTYDKDGHFTGVKHDVLRDGDGAPFTASTEKRAEEIYAAKNATDELVGIIDDVRKLGVEWQPNTANSAKLQKIQQKWATARAALLKQSGFGVPSESDWGQIDKMIGSADPTKWRDQLPGIMSARETILKKFNVALRNDKYTGDDYAPPDISGGGTPDDASTAYQGISQEKTPAEQEAAAKVGRFRGAAEYVAGGGPTAAIGGTSLGQLKINDAAQRAENAANAGSTKYPYGFSKDNDENIKTLLDTYYGGADKGAKDNAKTRLLELAKSKDEGRRAAGLNLLRAEARPLYNEALASMSVADRETEKASAANRIRATRTDVLEQSAIGGDTEAGTELLRRQADGDREAGLANQRIIKVLQKRASGNTK